MKKVIFSFLLFASASLYAQQKMPATKNATTRKANPRQVAINPIQKYLNATGLQSGDLWNAAFVYWCFNSFPGGNPLLKTGSGMEMWNRLSSQYKLSADQAKKEPNRILPGNIFFISESEKEVRVGIVLSVNNDELETVEADTYVRLTRMIHSETVIRKKRKLSEIDLGFSNFTNESNPSNRKSGAK